MIDIDDTEIYSIPVSSLIVGDRMSITIEFGEIRGAGGIWLMTYVGLTVCLLM